ncbi:rhodanese-like domain-containing protein [Lysinibacillus xylanilyticus]|uniref:rhodanese-like domain-containing protein n=1 Tax=Lysinibacillus xylanilyticus TaxID=582475 RepID=UPI003D08CD40
MILGIISLGFSILICRLFYIRYFPAINVKYLNKRIIGDDKSFIIIDVREYNAPSYRLNHETIHLPLAYVHRHYFEIDSKKEVVLIVSDQITKNMAARLLKNKGFKVKGYIFV